MNHRALSISLAALALAATSSVLDATPAEAKLSLRGGADLRPLLYVNDATAGSLGDFGYLGLHVAPGIGLADILTLEVIGNLWIPISGGGDVDFMVAPGVRLDLFIAYARANLAWLPVGKNVGIEAAAGLSILTFGYLGVVADVFFDPSLFMLGLEAGVRFSF